VCFPTASLESQATDVQHVNKKDGPLAGADVNKFGATAKGVCESRVRLSSYAADNGVHTRQQVTACKCSSRRVR